MDPITVPRHKSVRDPDRPVSSLLLAQMKHLREAEKSLPPRYHSGIFSHAIQTEGEAARYIRAVTEAIHAAHDDAAAERVRRARARKRKGVIETAAAAEAAKRKKMPAKRRRARSREVGTVPDAARGKAL